ncbi:unnamed protein product, partial [Prorocentrum cordatum]
ILCCSSTPSRGRGILYSWCNARLGRRPPASAPGGMSCFEGLMTGGKKKQCLIYDDIAEDRGLHAGREDQQAGARGRGELYAKLEYFNPLSSVKDRLANAIIEDGEDKGLLKPGESTVIEATSGNTGIALAMVCAQRGYKFVAVMAASFSVERRKVMRALGAKVIVTPAALGGTGMVKKAEESWLRSTAGTSPGSSRRTRTRPTTRRRRGPRSWKLSRARSSTTG